MQFVSAFGIEDTSLNRRLGALEGAASATPLTTNPSRHIRKERSLLSGLTPVARFSIATSTSEAPSDAYSYSV
ncbi:hypothetical protein ACJ73_03184 [Blastomyces percursus]|uniref:Uncharacterized protein n=1 Tax=Blastomyces percursus TaxID=1658174 RepID=A0A1J9RBW0_9EURO|nr:hypothetical protein ACJ73_03184 [Blastomyces percursus]